MEVGGLQFLGKQADILHPSPEVQLSRLLCGGGTRCGEHVSASVTHYTNQNERSGHRNLTA